MALLKRSFKVYGKQDIQTKYLAFDGTNKKPVAHNNGDLVAGKINPLRKCIPAGSLVKFDGTSKAVVAATEAEAKVDGAINNSVFLLAEDLYAPKDANDTTGGDPGFVYWVVEDVNNLEAR